MVYSAMSTALYAFSIAYTARRCTEVRVRVCVFVDKLARGRRGCILPHKLTPNHL